MTKENTAGQASPLVQDDDLFRDVATPSQVWMSHSDTIKSLPDDFSIAGYNG